MAKDSIRTRQILSDIEAAVVKSTSGGENLPEDKHVNEILFLVSNSPGFITFLAGWPSAKLESTSNDAAALKVLALIHRLLRGGNRFFEQDLRLSWSSVDLRISPQRSCDHLPVPARKNGVAHKPSGKARASEASGVQPASELRRLVLHKVLRCQSLLGRAVQSLPESRSLQHEGQLIVMFVLGLVVRESFRVHHTLRDGIETAIASSVTVRHARYSVLGDLRKARAQTPKLQEFYTCCKRIITGKNLEYPTVSIITDAETSMEDSFAAAAAEEGSNYEEKMKNNAAREEGVDMKVQPREGGSSPFPQKHGLGGVRRGRGQSPRAARSLREQKSHGVIMTLFVALHFFYTINSLLL